MLSKIKKRVVSATVVLSLMIGMVAPVYAAGTQTAPAQIPSEGLSVLELLPGQTLEAEVENAGISLTKGSTTTCTTSTVGSPTYPASGSISRAYVWGVSNPNVLSISSNGQSCTVRAVGTGTAWVECKVCLSYQSYDTRLKKYISRYEEQSAGGWQITVTEKSSGSSSGGSSSGSSSSGGSSSGSSSSGGTSSGSSSSGSASSGGSSSGGSSSGGSSSGDGVGILLGGAALVAAGVVLYHYADDIKAALSDAFSRLTKNLPSAEEKAYAAVYDYRFYRDNNADLQAAFGDDRSAYLNHFLTAGMAEGRQASAEFDVHVYRANNPDLNAAFGNNLSAYYTHYIETGKTEGRVAR